MRTLVLTLGLAGWLGAANTAHAQFINKPIDTSALIVQPADTATNIFSGTAKIINRVIADAVDKNGFVKTINNLLGRTPDPKSTTQLNGLPLPTLYPSTKYPNSFTPAMPTTMQFGQSVPVRR